MMYTNSRTNQVRIIYIISHFIIASVLIIAIISPDGFYVMAPALACFVAVAWLWITLWRRDQKIPFFDAGFFCALATLVYAAYPLVNYWADGFQFGGLSDNRLRVYNPSPLDMFLFHLRHVLYLFSFVGSYALFRGRGPVKTETVNGPGRSVQHAIVVIFILLSVYFLGLEGMTGANYDASYEPDSYAINLEAFSRLPLLLIQLSGKLSGILFLFKLALLFIVVSRCKQRRWLVLLFAWIVVEIIQTLVVKGARTGLVLFLMATALYYHRMVRPLSLKYLLTSGISFFLFFIFLGFYRMYIDVGALQTDMSQAYRGFLYGGNEFQSLLGTAYDVLQRKESGAYLPWYLYINDFITILPPQQLVPFEKVAASEWYLREIGLSGMGVGFMWGVISQSIVGLDWVELLLRGWVLGFILAKIHGWYVKNQIDFMATLLYVYLCLKVYYTFRDTTFSLLANLVWEVIPFYILLRMIEFGISRKRSGQTNHRI